MHGAGMDDAVLCLCANRARCTGKEIVMNQNDRSGQNNPSKQTAPDKQVPTEKTKSSPGQPSQDDKPNQAGNRVPDQNPRKDAGSYDADKRA
jgi:hypothetical protein